MSSQYGIIIIIAIVYTIIRHYRRKEEEKAKTIDKEGYRINQRGGTLVEDDRLSNAGRSEASQGQPMRSRKEKKG